MWYHEMLLTAHKKGGGRGVHSTMAMTERYSHLAPDHFRQAVDTLEAVRRKKPAKMLRIGE